MTGPLQLSFKVCHNTSFDIVIGNQHSSSLSSLFSLVIFGGKKGLLSLVSFGRFREIKLNRLTGYLTWDSGISQALSREGNPRRTQAKGEMGEKPRDEMGENREEEKG
jgi:hypothetical protein